MAIPSFHRTLASHGQRRAAFDFTNQNGGLGWQQHRRLSLPEVACQVADFASEKQGKTENSPTFAFDSEAPEVKCRILEAILLIAKEPLSARRLAALAGLADPTHARTLARRLNGQYDLHGHAFRIEEIAGGMQLLTRPQFSAWLRRLGHVPGEELLSQGMLESLAIVAYRQPILRAEIESIRGVSCDEVLRQLMQRDLVRICGRVEDLGRPYLYGTTKRFLQLFGLQSLESLPRAQKIRCAEAEIASSLAGNRMSVQDIDKKSDLKIDIPHSTSADHH